MDIQVILMNQLYLSLGFRLCQCARRSGAPQESEARRGEGRAYQDVVAETGRRRRLAHHGLRLAHDGPRGRQLDNH